MYKKSICFISFFMFSIIYILLITNNVSVFDNAFYAIVQKLIQATSKDGNGISNLTTFFKLISNIGGTIGVIIILVFLVGVPKTRTLVGYKSIITISISVVLNSIIKKIVMRPRPDILRLVTETNYSFPSGHSMNNMALYTVFILATIAYIKDKNTKTALIIFYSLMPLLIAFSRVYLGVHYLSDVLAGLSLGMSIALFLDIYLFKVKKD